MKTLLVLCVLGIAVLESFVHGKIYFLKTNHFINNEHNLRVLKRFFKLIVFIISEDCKLVCSIYCGLSFTQFMYAEFQVI